ncbi:MAG: hypothetical protein C4326_02905 [Ignavibacteria bacterium]
MPVRSLNSSVLKWPDAPTVEQAVRAWTEEIARQHPEVLRIGYFGLYARGNWGVGSDVDIIVIIDQSEMSCERRSIHFDATCLPVPADVLVYARDEWSKLREEGRGMQKRSEEIVWLCEKAGGETQQSDDHV